MYIPLFIDFSNLKVLVIGCGSVGLRRASLFSNAGAKVTTVCRESEKRIEGVNVVSIDIKENDIETIKQLVKDHHLVVIAIDSESLASAIARIAISLGKLVNNAVDSRLGNTIVPLRLSLNGIDIGITSYGISVEALRRMARKIEILLESDIEIKTLIHICRVLKKCVKIFVQNHKERMNLYRSIFTDDEFNRYVSKGDTVSAFSRAIDIARGFGFEIKECIERGLDQDN
uniref:precorrin-2 dehydrogenase n=2 Tax=Ignisphaera aggregans TaxID=334771 RepID=A0A7J3MZ80_9CREN